MLALITGATGFLGSHILRQWLAESHTARALYRSPAKLRLIADLP
ncbi:MAG: NAD-dependent epimerase/dehydratase family protein, partial [Chloroflexi bacterium]|nr:NAD-dependent epimerase/dehydratase family protein [Chloroflexota bacterium]